MLKVDQPLNLDKLKVFAAGVDHSEGVTVTLDGTLYAGGEAGQIYRIDNDQPVTVANLAGFMLGLASDALNRVYAIDSANKCVWRYDPLTQESTKWLEGPNNMPLNVPNWGSFGPDGSYYLTDSGSWNESDGLIWVKHPHEALKIFTRESPNFPNGCAVSYDGTKLFVVESAPSSICEININPDGSAGTRRILIELGNLVPDGIREVEDGSLIISFFQPNLVAHLTKEGVLVTLALDPQGVLLFAPTNFDFMGVDRKTIVFANLGCWHLTRANFNIAGVLPHFPTSELIGS
ncbi:MAG: SMP-30/gluconolactonase/LRE family protein [Actinobacteria bacterium]|nr:SMP-30/gluconolactonase/LRE family protein [Actinomycetota bacterium]